MANFNRINLGGVTDTIGFIALNAPALPGTVFEVSANGGSQPYNRASEAHGALVVVLEGYQEGLDVDSPIPMQHSVNGGVILSGSQYAVRAEKEMELYEGQYLFFGGNGNLTDEPTSGQEPAGYSVYNTTVKAGELVAVRFI